MRELESSKKAFSLIEVIIGLAIIGIIAVFLLPSFSNILLNKKKVNENSKRIFALEYALESSKKAKPSSFVKDINGIEVDVEIEDMGEFRKIHAESQGYFLDLVVKND